MLIHCILSHRTIKIRIFWPARRFSGHCWKDNVSKLNQIFGIHSILIKSTFLKLPLIVLQEKTTNHRYLIGIQILFSILCQKLGFCTQIRTLYPISDAVPIFGHFRLALKWQPAKPEKRMSPCWKLGPIAVLSYQNFKLLTNSSTNWLIWKASEIGYTSKNTPTLIFLTNGHDCLQLLFYTTPTH